MRTAFLALLLVNLMYLAWAEWIDVPVLPPNAIAGLPRLRLAREASRSGPAAQAAASGVTDAPGTTAAQCISIGPFDNDTDVARATSLLVSQGLPPRQRVAQSPPVRWYWVYLHNPGGAAQIQQLLRHLTKAGIQGAAPLAMGSALRISLGLFQDEQLAQQQRQLAQQKGFQPVLTERLISQPVYWLDLWVTGGTDSAPLQALKAEAGTPIGIQACPSGETSTMPAAPSAPQAVSPGIPAPEATATAAPASPPSRQP